MRIFLNRVKARVRLSFALRASEKSHRGNSEGGKPVWAKNSVRARVKMPVWARVKVKA
jgi:hypothetical protein